jgi:serine/threonine protein phosphatase PrpC
MLPPGKAEQAWDAAILGMRCSAASARGRRPTNEDRVVARPTLGLWAVADGAGGHGGGARAAAAVAAALEALPAEPCPPTALPVALAETHAALQAQGRGRGPLASTVVVLVLAPGSYTVLWAGDSRLYRLRGGVLERLTDDHSLVSDLVAAGLLTAAEAEHHPQANVITRAVGQEGALELAERRGEALPGDCFLLATDGLYRDVSDTDLAGLLSTGASAEALVAAAVAAGGRDNASAVVVWL